MGDARLVLGDGGRRAGAGDQGAKAAAGQAEEEVDDQVGADRGEYVAAEFKRIGKGGKEVWIQASYNPILDLNGKPFKVVKYASDTTRQVMVRLGNERVRSMMESVAAGSEEKIRESVAGG